MYALSPITVFSFLAVIMPGLSDSSPNATLHGGEVNGSNHEVPLLGALGNHLAHEELPAPSMSKDEGLLAHLGYKQGNLLLLSEVFRIKLTIC